MAELATLNKDELKSRLSRMRTGLAKAREATRETVKRGTGLIVVSAGGFAAGVIDDRMPEIGGLPTNVMLGGALALGGLLDAAGDQSELLCDLGGGILAGASYGQGVKMSRELAQRAGG